MKTKNLYYFVFSIIIILISVGPSMSATDDSVLVIFSSTEGGGTGDFIQNQNTSAQDADFWINGMGGVNYFRITPNPTTTPIPQTGDIKTMGTETSYGIYTYDGDCWRKLNPWDGTTCYGTELYVNAGSDVSICPGGSTNLIATPSGGWPSYSYDWNNDETDDWDDPQTITVNPTVTTVYTVRVRDNYLNIASDNVTVTFNTSPSAPTAGSNSPVWVGSTISLTASSISGATYSWTGPNGYISNIQNPSISNATTSHSGTYYVTATVNGCPSPAGSVNVTVNQLPTGGTVTTFGSYRIHTFTSSGIFTAYNTMDVEVLVVAGGGSGGRGYSGGGGAGGLIYYGTGTPHTGTSYSISSGAITVTVGAGGAGLSGGGGDQNGNQGSNSSFGSLIAIGGGYGGAENLGAGGDGGSGGGASYSGTVGNATSGQGNNGGVGKPGGYYPSGGGGGAGAVGETASSNTSGGTAPAGGIGLQYSISGTAVYYAGGGGAGAGYDSGGGYGGPGGNGGGGNGGNDYGSNKTAATNGADNTGGGGGGGNGSNYASGAGGSGIVIVRYPYTP